MKRKLIQLSPSTIVTSLPAKWVQKNNLKKGDEVQVTEVENTLVLSTQIKQAQSKITINLKDFNEKLAFLHADSAYIAGYDEITFLINGKEQTEIMQYVANEVPGMIITKQTQSEIVFKDITAGQSEDISILINRIMNMNIAILEDGLIAIQHKDWETVRKLKRRDYVMGSYISYCQRMINKYGFAAFSKTGLIVNYLKLLEMIADKYCAMFKLVAKSKIQAENETKQLISIYKSIQRVHETYSQKKIIALNNERQSLKTTNKQLEYSIETIKELLFDLIEVEAQFQL